MRNEITNRIQLEAQADALRSRLAEKLETLEALPLRTEPAPSADAALGYADFEVAAADPDNDEVPREVLETKADVQRWRLARSLESLSRRWHDAWNLKLQIARHPVPAILAGAGALLAVGGSIGVIAYCAQPRRSWPIEQLRTLGRYLSHLD
jgi:hypothetical protein